MENETPPKKRKPKFGDWQAPPDESQEPLADRADFAGLGPAEAADRLVAVNMTRRKLRPPTCRQKRMVAKMVLRALAERRLDLSTATSADILDYRRFLAAMADNGVLSRDYCSHILRVWNSLMTAAFGDRSKPGDGLRMRGFPQSVRKVQRLTESEISRMFLAIPKVRFRDDHYRNAFTTWLEMEWSAGPRIGSTFNEKLQVRHIDWVEGLLKLEHMKNSDEGHTVVLNSRAQLALQAWVAYLRTLPSWRGPETVVFAGKDGKPLTQQWVNRKLKQTATAARIPKRLTTHVLRKSVGTIIAKGDPTYGRLQLGITRQVFERHYNQPLIEDRIERRDILPGADWKPKTPEEIAGVAALALQDGRITPDEFRARMAEAEKLRSLPERGRFSDPAYG